MEIYQPEIGHEFFRVEYYGALTKYTIIEIDEANCKFSLTGLTDLSNEEYKLKEDPKPWASSSFNIDLIIENKNGEYFMDLDRAKAHSLARFEKEVNPKGVYRVARYFDDMFEQYVTENMSKKEAREKCNELNKSPRHYVYYGIVQQKSNKQ